MTHQAPKLAPGSQAEDALKHIHEAEYAGVPATHASIAGALQVSVERAGEVASSLAGRGLVHPTGTTTELTEAGRKEARQILRAHRIYETYLARETGVATEDWHRHADQAEHHLSTAAVDALAEKLGRPRYDPHGDPIPTRGGSMPPPRGRPLLQAAAGGDYLVVHLEDEPEGVYRRAAACGIHAGSRLRILDRGIDALRVAVEDRVCELPLVVAGALQVEPCEPSPKMRPLSSLGSGDSARVVRLSPALVGAERRRLLDLGLVPGTGVRREFDSMLGSPVAYRIRGAMVALRREQADRIFVEA